MPDRHDASDQLGSSNASEPTLARRLGPFDATMIVMGGIIGAGIFVNPSVVARQVHTPALVLMAGGALAREIEDWDEERLQGWARGVLHDLFGDAARTPTRNGRPSTRSASAWTPSSSRRTCA